MLTCVVQAVRDTFDLSCAVVDCSSGISLDDFCEATLIGDDPIAHGGLHKTCDLAVVRSLYTPRSSIAIGHMGIVLLASKQ